MNIGKDFNQRSVRGLFIDHDIAEGVMPQWPNNTKQPFSLTRPEQFVNSARFVEAYPHVTIVNENGKKKDAVQLVMLMADYVNAAVNAPKFEHEECQHIHVQVKREQTRSIDEMESLTRYCLDCGFVTMHT